MRRDIFLQRTYAHPPDAIWRAFASSGALAQWLMPNTFEPRAGYRFEFRSGPAPNGIVRCEVLEVYPPRRLSFTWAGRGFDTTVRFDLIPEPHGTRVALTHSGFAGVRGVLLRYKLGNGWEGMLDRTLPAAVVALSVGEAAPARAGEATAITGQGYRRHEDTGTTRRRSS